MPLPFSREAFFEVFARYNLALWPVVLALWVAAAAVLAATVSRPGRRSTNRAAGLLLAVLWLWTGGVYHALYFAAINPAAWSFAALFVVEAGLLAWHALVSGRLAFGSASAPNRIPGTVLALSGLAYPILNAASQHPYPATPSFGVPCPTALFTVGLLLGCRRPPVAVVLIPVTWSVLAGSAASSLGVRADLVLLPAALMLGIHVVIEGAQSCWRWS
jgi:hypothetical protein